MSMKTKTLDTFTDELASKAAVPGGGGASALTGAIGIALGDMVGELTVGKKKYADVEEDVKALMERAKTLRERFLELIDEDAAAFEPLSKAYGIPKDDPSRGPVMEECLRQAAKPPLDILHLCCEAISLVKDFAEKGSVIAISDAATGAAVLKGAMLGAAVNVKVNTKAMADREYADAVERDVNAAVEKYGSMADEIYKDVCGRVC